MTRRLYIDCDGVLADFDGGFMKVFGTPPRGYEDANGSDIFWRDIKNEGRDFFRNLAVLPGATDMMKWFRKYRPIILTGCPKGGWAEMQKIEWAREHFPGIPIITCRAKDKRDYCEPGDILLDDRIKYAERWAAYGGIFVRHHNPDQSIVDVEGVINHKVA